MEMMEPDHEALSVSVCVSLEMFHECFERHRLIGMCNKVCKDMTAVSICQEVE
ncbi:hypothetical protein [Haladaptatus sp. W1]|uniref:hypothetical protein n=1 Tax=Haladaptatus sp. W1 TaxID=1897478 RepID=UPI001585D90E|nr:hypothetical protein [Haladaptatus sp. W1]